MTQELNKELTDTKSRCHSLLDQDLLKLVKKLTGTKAEEITLDPNILLLINQTAKVMKDDKISLILFKIVVLYIVDPLNLLVINQKLNDMIDSRRNND